MSSLVPSRPNGTRQCRRPRSRLRRSLAPPCGPCKRASRTSSSATSPRTFVRAWLSIPRRSSASSAHEQESDMTPPDLLAFAGAIATGDIEVVDLTHTLTPEFPTIVMPPELGQCAPFRMEEVSRYDERGSAWYWNNISMGEHTGTHFDAPVHWISGKDLPHNSVDTIPPRNFIAPAAVIDISKQSAANADYELTVADVKAWEKKHGRIPPRSWVLLRTDWYKRTGRDYVNMREDGQHSPGPCPEVVRF